MKTAHRSRFAQAICAEVPELHARGPLLAMLPRGSILRGIYLETSAADPDGVYIWAFVQPLFVPRSTIVLSLGERLGGGSKTWKVDEAKAAAALVRSEGIPFIMPLSSPEALLSWNYLEGRSDTYALEVRGNSLIACGRFVEGAKCLRTLAASLGGEKSWMIEMQNRVMRLAELAETCPQRARALLDEWEGDTATALHVSDLP